MAAAGSNCFDIYMRNKKFEQQRTKDFEEENRAERRLKKKLRKLERENSAIEEKRAKKRRKSNFSSKIIRHGLCFLEKLYVLYHGSHNRGV